MSPRTPVPDRSAVDANASSFRAPQVCALTGVTYRQLDYWAKTDLLKPSIAEAKGSGSQRLYSATDVTVARIIASLVYGERLAPQASNSRLSLAREIAPLVRQIVDDGAAADLILVVTVDEIIPLTDEAELCQVLRRHPVATVISGFDHTVRDAAPGASGADVDHTSHGVSPVAAPVG